MNIKNKKKTKENFPHNPKSSVTYPVPDNIEITLKEEILILSIKLLSKLINNKYSGVSKRDALSGVIYKIECDLKVLVGVK